MTLGDAIDQPLPLLAWSIRDTREPAFMGKKGVPSVDNRQVHQLAKHAPTNDLRDHTPRQQ